MSKKNALLKYCGESGGSPSVMIALQTYMYERKEYIVKMLLWNDEFSRQVQARKKLFFQSRLSQWIRLTKSTLLKISFWATLDFAQNSIWPPKIQYGHQIT
jgi:hypothetical protein